jgi:iron complex outermembrane receptor protein
VVGFINTSDLGSTFGDFPTLDIIRSPERIRGIEADLNAQPVQQLRVGGTLTLQEGKRDADDDGDYETYLPGSRIAPTKVTGYVAYTPTPDWQTRLQVLHSGSRDRFDGEAEAAFGQGDVEPYTVFDLTTSYEIGPGTVKLGIENLFDTFYFPNISQWYNLGFGYTAAPGRQVSLSYAVTW